MGVNEGLADSGVDGLFSLGESSLDLLVVFELIEAHDVEISPATFVDVVDEEVSFDLGGCAFGHLNKIILILKSRLSGLSSFRTGNRLEAVITCPFIQV